MFDCVLMSEKREVRVRFAGSLTADNALGIKGKLIEAVGEGKDVVVELEALTGADPLIILYLLAAYRTVSKGGRGFRLIGPLPDIFLKAVRGSGFSSHDDYMAMTGGVNPGIGA